MHFIFRLMSDFLGPGVYLDERRRILEATTTTSTSALAAFVAANDGRGNPVNYLSLLVRQDEKEIREHRPAPWRLEVAAALLRSGAPAGCLVLWAAVEDLNRGSHQRLDCPVEVRGSGRWLADDGGGHYWLLLTSLRRWLDLPADERRRWERLGSALEAHPDFHAAEIADWLAQMVGRLREDRLGRAAGSAISGFFRYMLAGTDEGSEFLAAVRCLRRRAGDPCQADEGLTALKEDVCRTARCPARIPYCMGGGCYAEDEKSAREYLKKAMKD